MQSIDKLFKAEDRLADFTRLDAESGDIHVTVGVTQRGGARHDL